MKVGDTVPVSVAGQTVAMAEVKEMADGTATLIVPATRVVMATRTELTMEEPSGGTVQILTDDVVRPETADTTPVNNGQPEVTSTNPAEAVPAPAAPEQPVPQPVEAPTPVEPVQPVSDGPQGD